MRLFFDMSAVLWAALLGGKDVEGQEVEFEGGKAWVNSASYGYENAVNSMVSALNAFNATPYDCVMVFEGQNSKARRLLISTDYKANRGKRPAEAYEAFNVCKERIQQAFRGIGMQSVKQDFVEGDDVLAYLAQNSSTDCAVVTVDNDLLALQGLNRKGAQVWVRVSGSLVDSYKGYPLSCITLYKTLVGDTSDNIKGCPGFGEKAFAEVFKRYGEDGCLELLRLIETCNRDTVEKFSMDNKCKYLGKVVDKWPEVTVSHSLSLLRPEWVNTVQQPLVWSGGLCLEGCSDERLAKYSSKTRLITADNYDNALEFLRKQLPLSPFVAFDIETSVPNASMDWSQAANVKVDVMGSYLVGFSITFGRNSQFTYYVSVAHYDTNNITLAQAQEMLTGLPETVVHNANFELPVLFNSWGESWKANGFQGFLPNIFDTKLEASYVNENIRSGLKLQAETYLDYKQETYEEVTQLELPQFPGGEFLSAGKIRYRMHELSAEHVKSYGCDDATVTAALHHHFKLRMELEDTYETYKAVEIKAAYLHAQMFVNGVDVDLGKLQDLRTLDDKTYKDAWATLREYLIEKGWQGTKLEEFKVLDAKTIKLAYSVVADVALDDEDEDDEEESVVEEAPDPVLKSRFRTPSKLIKLIEEQGFDTLAQVLTEGSPTKVYEYALTFFKGEPKIKFSNKQLSQLMYDTMGLPIVLRGKVTETMHKKGIREGNPKANALAIAYAMRSATSEQKAVLKAISNMVMVTVRRGLYYNTYPYFVHWKTGKIHSSHNQCATNTRRASSSGPNLQQLPKHEKVEGQPARFREVLIPHSPDAVIVSLDFAAQELRVIAEWSKDPAMLSCFVGDELRDMHALTAVGIWNKQHADKITYQEFMQALGDKSHPLHKAIKECRSLGKKTNFTTEFGSMAPKLAETLLVSEPEAQSYLDAKEAVFIESGKWKKRVIAESKATGTTKTLLGAVRHLGEAYRSPDRWVTSKAERQSVNFKVQSSSAEMTKLAEGRLWDSKVFTDFDAHYISPIHDEIVCSVLVADLPKVIPILHQAMVADYAGMTVPIVSSISWGKNFGQQDEKGEILPEVQYG